MREDTTKDTAPTKKALLNAVLELAPSTLWDSLTPESIAKQAGLTAEDFNAHFPHKTDLITALVQETDKEMSAAYTESTTDLPLTDRLFDIFMTRLEIMQKRRHGIIALAKEGRTRPDLAIAFYRAHKGSMKLILTLANHKSEQERPHTQLQIHGLLTVYHLTLLYWERDNSNSSQNTMSRLDGLLKRLEQTGLFVT